MRIPPLAACLLLGLVGCGDDDGRHTMVSPDAQDSTRASGCDDPALWTLPALAETEAESRMGGGECERPQLPLQRVSLQWKADYGFEAEQDKFVDRGCWRVTEAAPGSGWTAGQQIVSDSYDAAFNIVGFARPITVEGRALFQDGTIAYSIPPTKIELAPAMIASADASAVTALIGREGWAEHDAVRLWGQRIPTEEVLGATYEHSAYYEEGEAMTLHRVGANVVLRRWQHINNQVEYKELVIGVGTRGQLTKWGNAVLVDGTELVILKRQTNGNLIVNRRVTLPSEPLEIVEDGGSVWLHFAGTLMRAGTFDDTTQTLAVGDGVLLPHSAYDRTIFFDGTRLRSLEWTAQHIELDPIGFTPAAEDLARIGKPVGIIGMVVFGENGLLSIADLTGDRVGQGPASVSHADVFGDGHLGPVFVDDAATYVIEHDSGSAQLYQAPYNSFCNPI